MTGLLATSAASTAFGRRFSDHIGDDGLVEV